MPASQKRLGAVMRGAMSQHGPPGRVCTAHRGWAALAALLGLSAVPALAQAPAAAPPTAPACDDMVEVRLVNVSDPVIPPGTPMPPEALLRVPRVGTNVVSPEGGVRWLSKACEPIPVVAMLTGTRDVDGWAARFGIPYHDLEPAQQVSLSLRYPLAPLPPVDDSADQEGFAARGAWIIRQPHRTDRGSAEFCLLPPAPPGQCYASWGTGMTYRTGGLTVSSRVFGSKSLWKDGYRRITTADLDRHFAFLRALTAAVIVHMPDPPP